MLNCHGLGPWKSVDAHMGIRRAGSPARLGGNCYPLSSALNGKGRLELRNLAAQAELIGLAPVLWASVPLCRPSFASASLEMTPA